MGEEGIVLYKHLQEKTLVDLDNRNVFRQKVQIHTVTAAVIKLIMNQVCESYFNSAGLLNVNLL